MDEDLFKSIRRRADFCCEYCRLPEVFHPGTFEVEHVIAKQHGGRTVSRNLAFSCLHCNRHKGPNLSGIDSVTKKLTRLFHPRIHKWERHFMWDGPFLVGKTAIGRVTVAVLAMNAPTRVALRRMLLEEGVNLS